MSRLSGDFSVEGIAFFRLNNRIGTSAWWWITAPFPIQFRLGIFAP
jgi:hypothetical protein